MVEEMGEPNVEISIPMPPNLGAYVARMQKQGVLVTGPERGENGLYALTFLADETYGGELPVSDKLLEEINGVIVMNGDHEVPDGRKHLGTIKYYPVQYGLGEYIPACCRNGKSHSHPV